MLIPYNDTACIVCVITGRGTVTSYTLILRTLSRCTPRRVERSFRIARLTVLGHIAWGSKPNLLQQHETNASLQ
jgi:hypothetical protein